MSWPISTLFGTSIAPGSYTALTIVLSVLFATLGYRSSTRFRSLNGVTPWHVPSVVWAVICLVLTPIGFIIELLAQFTTRPSQNTAGAAQGRGIAPGAPHIAANVSTASPTGVNVQPIDDHPRFAPPKSEPGEKKPLFGWYPDVTGHHELRYWDGKGWTQLVSDGGIKSNDPLIAPKPE